MLTFISKGGNTNRLRSLKTLPTKSTPVYALRVNWQKADWVLQLLLQVFIWQSIIGDMIMQKNPSCQSYTFSSFHQLWTITYVGDYSKSYSTRAFSKQISSFFLSKFMLPLILILVLWCSCFGNSFLGGIFYLQLGPSQKAYRVLSVR
jgi:hypothetical protein